MFGFKRAVKKELNDLWTEIHKIQDVQTKAVPTFNKMIEKQKDIDTYIEGSTKLFQRIVKFIKLPKIETKGE